MKQNEIRYAGKQVFANQDELEEGYVEIVINIDDILEEIDDEYIAIYARYSLNMRHEDDFESSLDDFDDDELLEALKNNYYNFAKEVEEDEMIEYLEERGYTVEADSRSTPEYDYVDNCLFYDIVNKFNSLDCFSRQKMRDLIINL